MKRFLYDFIEEISVIYARVCLICTHLFSQSYPVRIYGFEELRSTLLDLECKCFYKSDFFHRVKNVLLFVFSRSETSCLSQNNFRKKQ